MAAIPFCDFISVCGQQKNVPGNAVVIENDIGYLVINTINTTHMTLEQVSAESGQTLDGITIVKDSL